MRNPFRRSRRASVVADRGAERVTVGLALVAVATLGALVAGEVTRLVRRRRESGQVPTPETIVDVAELATRDTIAVARRGIEATPHHETVLFNLLQGFLGAFAFARLSTWGIRHGWWPRGNVTVGGRHIHHFVPGIALAFASGIAGLTTRNDQVEAALAVPFGVGIGLTMDEAALLLDLRDVYWTREGILSVQVSLGATAMLAATILALRMLRRGEQKGAEEGLIPSTSEQSIASAGALA
jgi:zinc transporter ZupT